MCGICGFVSKNSLTEAQLEAMCHTIAHRGPDDNGLWMTESKGFHIGLAQCRLSIIDLSPLGHQPMFYDDGNLVIVFNGEIYNFQTLRQQLENDGYSFRSQCDTEILLGAYRKWGKDCLERLQGMFAFAVYDQRKNTLFFARDRIGKKPLYYYHKGSTLIFASELKAILKHPEFSKEIRMEEISRFLVNSYIDSANTIYQNTYKLEPGCQMLWDNGELTISHYYSYFEQFELGRKNLVTDFSQAKAELSALIERNVAERLVADVPAGIFMSAGIDSSLVAGMASRLSAKQVKTFTIGFHDETRNEAPRAKKIAQHLGTEHTEFYIGEAELLDLIEDIPIYYDEPFGDSSQIPTMAISALTRSSLTVALSGDGGDEFFCGYPTYERVLWAQRLDKLAGLANLLLCQPLKKKLPNTLRALLNNRDPDYKTQLIADVRDEFVRDIVKLPYRSPKFAIEKEIPATDWQEKRMLLDMVRYLPDDILVKTDRASMKYALENRCPLLDRSISEYSFRLPQSFKYYKGQKKWILKQLAYEMIPQELLDMPKSGFSIPMARWLNKPLQAKIAMFSEKTILEKQGIFNYDPMKTLIIKVAKADNVIYNVVLWNFMIFQMWYQRYIEDLWNK
jgi:asparagine synthase (glutamine-hydrolysing)